MSNNPQKVSSYVRLELPTFSHYWAHYFYPSITHPCKKSLASSSLHYPIRQIQLSAAHHPFSTFRSKSSTPCTGSLQKVHVSLVPGSPKLDVALQSWLCHPRQREGSTAILLIQPPCFGCLEAQQHYNYSL